MRSTILRPSVFAGAVFLLALAFLLPQSGVYGLSLFAFVPIAVGGLGAVVVGAKTEKSATLAGALSGFLGSLFFLAIGVEGLICVVMVLPLVLPLAAIGGRLAYEMREKKRAVTHSRFLMLALPLSLAWDLNAPNPLFEVRSTMEINASPEVVWKNVVSFSDLPDPDEWYFKTGIAYPIRARIEGSGPAAIRYCEFSTGDFVEPIEVWEESTLLRFAVTRNAPPMQEWSPYGQVTPRHLHGYLVSEKGQFRLTRLANNRTLLEGTTWYRHGLLPAQYWRLWSDAIIHRIHVRVLNHIKTLSETGLVLDPLTDSEDVAHR